MNKLFHFLCIILIAAILYGCTGKAYKETGSFSTSEESKEAQIETGDGNSKKTIALILKTLTNPFFVDVESGAKEAEEELGINLIVKAGAQETFYEQQINIVEEMIEAKVDAIVISAVDSTKLVPVLKKALDANIPVVSIDDRLNPEALKKVGVGDVPFVTADNENGAYLSAKYISDKIKVPAKAAIIEGIPNVINSQVRKRGALKAFTENSNITVVATESAKWRIEDAYKVTYALFEKHPDIKLIFCANDLMALGTIQYLEENKMSDVLVAGFDCIKEARDAVNAGKLQVTINQRADLQGYTGIQLAYKLIKKEKVPDKTVIPVDIVVSGK